VGDLILSTAGGTPSSTTYVDTMLLKGDDYYNDHHYRGYCYEGDAIGQEREVSDWTLTDVANTLTFAPAFSPTIASGDEFELHRIFSADEYLKAINLAIEFMAGKYLVDIKVESGDTDVITLVADTYEYDLPLSMLYLYRVTTEDEVDGGEFYESGVIDPRDWSIMKAVTPQLKLHKGRYSITADKDLRLEGQGSQPIVVDDTDVIYLPPDWVVAKAITMLPWNKIQSNKLDGVYARAMVASAKEPRNWPNPRAQRAVE